MARMKPRTNRVHADNSDPDRTHCQVVRYARYGHEGAIERGIEHLMRSRQANYMVGSLAVQGKVLLGEIAAALDAAGLDPEDLMRSAMHNVRHTRGQA